MNQTIKYETGATSHAVNDLILFTDNTRELAELRDYVYTGIINNEIEHGKEWENFGELFRAAKIAYKKELGNSNSLHIIQMDANQIEEYCRLYANDFTSWKKEHGYN